MDYELDFHLALTFRHYHASSSLIMLVTCMHIMKGERSHGSSMRYDLAVKALGEDQALFSLVLRLFIGEELAFIQPASADQQWSQHMDEKSSVYVLHDPESSRT